MRRALFVAVCCLPLVLSPASAGGSSTQALRGKIVYSSDRGPNVRNAEIYSIGIDGSRRVDLTRNQGNDGAFAWSPTGDRVAFWSTRPGATALYVMRSDGSEQLRVTPTDILVSGAPTWSPDGRRVAFTGYRDGYGIWVVDANGSNLRLLAEGRAPVWAPVGSRIAFIGEDVPYAWPLEVVDADSGDLLHVADGQVLSAPTWSPDGRMLAFAWNDSATGRRALYTVDAGGGTRQALIAPQDLELADLAWSPSGTTIAFRRGEAMVTIGLDGGPQTTLGPGVSVAWSPDSRQLAIGTDAEIDVVNADGFGRHEIRIETPASITAGPRWSPDGTTLLFTSMRNSADHEIFVADADGSNDRQLTRNDVEDLVPAWSPDHRRIAFARKTARRTSIWVMNADGTRRHRLALGTRPGWSPSGSRIVFERGAAVYTMSDRGRGVRRLRSGRWPAWAPRGKRIAFVRARKLYVVGADGRGVRALASFSCASFGEGDPAKPVPSAPEWSPDGHELAVTVTCDHDRVVEAFANLVDADNGSVFERVPIDLAFGQTRVAWSPDGSRLAYPAAAELYADAPRIATALLDGSSTTTVTSGTGDDGDPDW